MADVKVDKRVKHGRTRPRFGSKRWDDYHKIAPPFFICMRCRLVLLNPMSTLTGAGHVCEKAIDKVISETHSQTNNQQG